MTNFIVAAVVALILGVAIYYMIKEKKKKKGTACIGCPNAGNCAKGRKSELGCSTTNIN